MNLPFYRCHKIVRAAKIIHIYDLEGTGSKGLTLDVPDGEPAFQLNEYVTVDIAWLTRNPAVAIGGYFVEYQEGDKYSAYSPAGPFESGYTPELPIIACDVKLDDETRERLMAEINKPGRILVMQGPVPEEKVDIELLAFSLHEAGRAAVEAGNTVAAEKFGEQTRKFMEWDEITEPAREGRRIQARWLLFRYRITKLPPMPMPE